MDDFIYELQKSTTIAFSRNSLYTFYSRNPTCGIHQCLRISNREYPPCPQNSIIVNPTSPSEILKAVRGMVWIFSGIAHSNMIINLHARLELIWSNLDSLAKCPLCIVFLLRVALNLIMKARLSAKLFI